MSKILVKVLPIVIAVVVKEVVVPLIRDAMERRRRRVLATA